MQKLDTELSPLNNNQVYNESEQSGKVNGHPKE
jgi:hypothetical protein